MAVDPNQISLDENQRQRGAGLDHVAEIREKIRQDHDCVETLRQAMRGRVGASPA